MVRRGLSSKLVSYESLVIAPASTIPIQESGVKGVL